MTDHESALVLLTDTDIELLGEDAEAARGYGDARFGSSRSR